MRINNWLDEDYPMAEMADAAKSAVIKEFKERGRTVHSAQASTLRSLIDHCEQNKIPYILHGNPGSGYLVENPLMIAVQES
jgi:hypothetical protein